MHFRPRGLALSGLIALLSFLPILPATAQNAAPPSPAAPLPAPIEHRPRIGLALAGGSAYGESHIGVLIWMEEHHIPIDYIAGTSMGGLVAGAYSCGYSPEELQKLLSTLDWQSALRGDTPYPALAFRRKEDVRAIPNPFEFGIGHGVTLPAGLNPAHKIGLLLSQIAYPCSTAKSFDDLPIPFRCVATDLRTGQEVIMKDGSLATALRATMALPAIFTPVERDGHLLCDGGILDNIPTDAVKDMGADTIIAVDLSASDIRNADAASLQTLLSIVGRSAALAVRANERASLERANVILDPDMKGLSSNDFLQTPEFIKRGYAAAEAQKEKLLPFALNDADWQAYVTARAARRPKLPEHPSYITVAGPNRATAHHIAQELRPLLHEPFPSKDGDDRLTLLTGDGRYNSVQYEAVTDDQGRTGLRIMAQEKVYGPPFLRAGLNIDGSDTKSVQVNAVARYIGLDAGMPGAEERLDFSLGSTVQTADEYLMRVGGSESRYFVAPRVFYTDNDRNTFANGARTSVYTTTEYGGGADAGFIASRFAQFRLGFQDSRVESGVRTGVDAPSVRGTVQSLHLNGVWDRLDDGIIPHSGYRAVVDTIRYLKTPAGDKPFDSAELRVSRFIPESDTLTLFGIADGGTTFGKDAPQLLQFTLGGPFRLGGVGVQALSGNDYFLLTTGVLHQIASPPLLGGRTLLGLWAEYGGTSGATFSGADNGTHFDVSAGVITETFLGPLLVGISAGDDGHGGIHTLPYFVLGAIF